MLFNNMNPSIVRESHDMKYVTHAPGEIFAKFIGQGKHLISSPGAVVFGYSLNTHAFNKMSKGGPENVAQENMPTKQKDRTLALLFGQKTGSP